MNYGEKSPSVTQRGARKSFWWFVSGCFRAELHAEYLCTEYLKLIRIYDHQSLWQLTLSQTTPTHEHFNHGGKKQKRCLTTSDKALKFCSSKQRIYSVHQSIHSLPLPVTHWSICPFSHSFNSVSCLRSTETLTLSLTSLPPAMFPLYESCDTCAKYSGRVFYSCWLLLHCIDYRQSLKHWTSASPSHQRDLFSTVASFPLPVICKHSGKVLAMISFANCVRLQQVRAARHFILMAYVGRCVRAWKRECGIGLFFSSKSVWWETFHTLPYLPVVSKRKNTQCLQRSSIKKWYWHRDVCLEVNDSEAYWLTCQKQTAICMVWIIKRRHRRIQTAADS